MVDDDVTMPASFAITFRSIGESDPIYKIGDIVEISPPGGLIEKPLVKGEITAISGDYDATGNRSTCAATTFPIVCIAVARRARSSTSPTATSSTRRKRGGIDIGTVDQTTTTYDYVSQANQTDWDFLKSGPRRTGYIFYIDEGKLYFKNPRTRRRHPARGTCGDDRVQARLRQGSDRMAASLELGRAGQPSRGTRLGSREQARAGKPGGRDDDRGQALGSRRPQRRTAVRRCDVRSRLPPRRVIR